MKLDLSQHADAMRVVDELYALVYEAARRQNARVEVRPGNTFGVFDLVIVKEQDRSAKQEGP